MDCGTNLKIYHTDSHKMLRVPVRRPGTRVPGSQRSLKHFKRVLQSGAKNSTQAVQVYGRDSTDTVERGRGRRRRKRRSLVHWRGRP
eukprot:997743-Rhodomonas_salina.1